MSTCSWIKGVSLTFAGLVSVLAPLAGQADERHNNPQIKRVLLLSIDGFHAVDLAGRFQPHRSHQQSSRCLGSIQTRSMRYAPRTPPSFRTSTKAYRRGAGDFRSPLLDCTLF